MHDTQDNIDDASGGDDDSDSGTTDNADAPVGATAMGRVGKIIQAVIRTLGGMLAQGKTTMYMLSSAEQHDDGIGTESGTYDGYDDRE